MNGTTVRQFEGTVDSASPAFQGLHARATLTLVDRGEQYECQFVCRPPARFRSRSWPQRTVRTRSKDGPRTLAVGMSLPRCWTATVSRVAFANRTITAHSSFARCRPPGQPDNRQCSRPAARRYHVVASRSCGPPLIGQSLSPPGKPYECPTCQTPQRLRQGAKHGGFTIVPADVELEGLMFRPSFWLRRPSRATAFRRCSGSRWLSSSTWHGFGQVCPWHLAGARNPPRSRRRFCCRDSSALPDGADAGVAFECSDHYGKTLHVSKAESDEGLKGRVADAFWSILLSEPDALADFSGRFDHVGAERYARIRL